MGGQWQIDWCKWYGEKFRGTDNELTDLPVRIIAEVDKTVIVGNE